MSVLANQPSNRNFLVPQGFRFVLGRAPNVTYFCQAAGLPSIVLQSVTTPTPFTALQHPGDKIAFDPISLRFRINEDLDNYLEISNWMRALGRPESFEEYQALVASNSLPQGEVFGDGTLVILTSNDNPNIEVRLENMFPTNLTMVQFDVTQQEIEYLEAEVTFNYTLFNINIL